jgi:hypothetical protein
MARAGAPSAPDPFQWQANQFVVARLHLPEHQPFDNPDAFAQQRHVSLHRVLPESAHRQIIHAHRAHTAFGQISRAISCDENEVLIERKIAPVAIGIRRAKQDALSRLNRIRHQFGAVDRGAVFNSNHARAIPTVASMGIWSIVGESRTKCSGASICVPVCALMLTRVRVHTSPLF